jgi:hypothetical protein
MRLTADPVGLFERWGIPQSIPLGHLELPLMKVVTLSLIFVCVSQERKSLSEISRLILETNQQSESGQQQEFEIKFPVTISAPLLPRRVF